MLDGGLLRPNGLFFITWKSRDIGREVSGSTLSVAPSLGLRAKRDSCVLQCIPAASFTTTTRPPPTTQERFFDGLVSGGESRKFEQYQDLTTEQLAHLLPTTTQEDPAAGRPSIRVFRRLTDP